MLQLFRFGQQRAIHPTKPARRSRLSFEQLERREVFASIGLESDPLPQTFDAMNPTAPEPVASIAYNSYTGQFTITGSNSSDNVQVNIDRRGTPTTADDVVRVTLANSAGTLSREARLYAYQIAVNKTLPGAKSLFFTGNGGNDFLLNSTGLATIAYGNAGNDQLFGGSGHDQFFGGPGDDYLDGRRGYDKLFGDWGQDKLFGDIGNDELHGGDDYDQLFGGAGADKLFGEGGFDILDGGPDTESVMSGGDGADWFYDLPGAFPGGDFHSSIDFATSGYHPLGWIDVLKTDALRLKTRELYADSQLSRYDMMQLFNTPKGDGLISDVELADLRALVNSQLQMDASVRSLAKKVVYSDRANLRYQGTTLGNLTGWCPAERLTKLVNKWFLGLDRPRIGATIEYRFISGNLYQNGISHEDVDQGQVADCFVLGPLAAIAHMEPETIQSMITDHGDGTYTVRFFRDSVAHYVTVDRYLPVRISNNEPYYAGWGFHQTTSGIDQNNFNDENNELWVALVEKAYVQMDESGWIGQDGNNSYDSISGGTESSVAATLRQITGRSTDQWQFAPLIDWDPTDQYDALIAAVEAGKSVVFCSDYFNWGDRLIVDGHVYALDNYNPTTRTFRIYNPWGLDAPDSQPTYVDSDYFDFLGHFLFWAAV